MLKIFLKQIKIIIIHLHLQQVSRPQQSMLTFRTKMISNDLAYYFSRIKKKDPLRIQQIRKATFEEQLQFSYALPLDQHQDLMYEENLYGKNCYVVGLTPNSRQSSRFIYSAVHTMNPTHLVLGNFNNSSMKAFPTFAQSHKIFSSLTNKYQLKYSPKDMFCRSALTPIIYETVNYNQDWYVQQKTDTILMADHAFAKINTNDYITAMNVISKKMNVRLSFGKPSDLIIFQDIMLFSDVQQLRQTYKRIVQQIKKKSKDTNRFSYDPPTILQQMKVQAEKESILYDKQITYLTALLNTYASVSQKVMVLVSRKFAPRIAQNIHKITIAPQNIYRKYLENKDSEGYSKLTRYLNPHNRQQMINQLLQKFAILNWLKNNALEIELIVYRKNIFNNTIFKQLFQNMSIDQIIMRYQAIKTPMKSDIQNEITYRIQNIRNHFQEGKKLLLTLPEQIKTQKQRAIDFPPHFRPLNSQTKKNQIYYQAMISKRMDQIVQQTKLQDEKMIYQQYKQGNYDQDNLIFVTKLMGQARAALINQDEQFKKITQTVVGKFPTYHYQAFRHFYKQQLSKQINNKSVAKQTVDKIQKMVKNNEHANHLKIHNIERAQQLDNYIKQHISPDDSGKKIKLTLTQDGELETDATQQMQFQDMVDKLEKQPFFKDIAEMLKKQKKQSTQFQRENTEIYSEFKQQQKSRQNVESDHKHKKKHGFAYKRKN